MGDTHYDSQTQPGDARAILTRVREAPPTAKQGQRWLDLWNDTSDRLQRIPNLDQDQLRPFLDRLKSDAQAVTPPAPPTAVRESFQQRMDRFTASLTSPDETAGRSTSPIAEVDGPRLDPDDDQPHQDQQQRDPRL